MYNKKVIIVYPFPVSKENEVWFTKEMRRYYEVKVYGTKLGSMLSGGLLKKFHKSIEIIIQCFKAVYSSNQNDIIICWDAVESTLCFAFSIFKGKRSSYILGLHWQTLVERKRSWLSVWIRRQMLNSNKVIVFVNQKSSIEQYIKYFRAGSEKSFVLLPDAYDAGFKFEEVSGSLRGGYCFAGGYNNRHWNFLIELASKMPEIKFVYITGKGIVDKAKLPSNIDFREDVEYTQFDELMKNSALVLMPLIEDRSSGLITIIRAAQHSRLCLSSNFEAISQYYSGENQDYLLHNATSIWKDKIEEVLSYDSAEYSHRVNDFQNYIKDNFSPEHAGNVIHSVIEKLEI